MIFKGMVSCIPCHGGGFTGSGTSEKDVCEYCGGTGMVTAEQAHKIKVCTYCDEIVGEVKHTPIVVDISFGAKMCKGCWETTRDDIKGTYGRDIGEWQSSQSD